MKYLKTIGIIILSLFIMIILSKFIGWGLILILISLGLYLLKKFYFKDKKKIKNINKAIYINFLIFISSCLHCAINGIPYMCPCQCGSQDIYWGIKGILKYIFIGDSDLIDTDYFLFGLSLIIISPIIHGIIMLIKFLIKKYIKKNKYK